MHKRRVIGAAIAVLALLAGMFSAPAAVASSGPRAAQETYCFLTPPEPFNEVLVLWPEYDADGDLFSVAGGWGGTFECGYIGVNSVAEMTLTSFFVRNNFAIQTTETRCSVADGTDPTCDKVVVSDSYECEGVGCAGEYWVRFRADVNMEPGVVMTPLPDYCTQKFPPPLQVVTCFGDSNKIPIASRSDG
jgi:hypothetical protein